MPPTPHRPWRLALLVWPLALVVTACLPEGVRVPQSELSALLEPKVGLIAYLGLDNNIYTIDQGGGKQTPLTSDAHDDASGYRIYAMPAWSPDSQSLAFAAYTGLSGAAPDSTSIFTAHSDGTGLIEALNTADFLIFWSWAPDGRRVGVIAQTPNNSLAFAVVPPQGGDSQVIDVGAPYYWSWAPSGHSLLVHAGGASPNANARLALLELDPDVSEQVLDLRPAEFKSPAFSPDGTQVLMAADNDNGDSELLVTDALGGNARVLTSYAGSIAFAWSPNGDRVAYLLTDSAQPGTPGQLVVADPAGQAKAVALGSDEQVYAFFWSPDSWSLAYFTEFTPDPPATAGASEGAATPTEPGQAATPSTADGQTVLLLSLDVMNAGNGNSHNVARFVPSERFLQLIPYFEQYHQSLTIWSPDSKNLVVSAYAGNQPGIFVVAASGHLEPRYIAEGWLGLWSWK